MELLEAFQRVMMQTPDHIRKQMLASVSDSDCKETVKEWIIENCGNCHYSVVKKEN